jgi:hypothetical protein
MAKIEQFYKHRNIENEDVMINCYEKIGAKHGRIKEPF